MCPIYYEQGRLFEYLQARGPFDATQPSRYMVAGYDSAALPQHLRGGYGQAGVFQLVIAQQRDMQFITAMSTPDCKSLPVQVTTQAFPI